MKYFVILSGGAYSDYSPQYYMGEQPLSTEQLVAKANEINKTLIEAYKQYPFRKSTRKYEWDASRVERYNPATGETMEPPYISEWEILMIAWLKQKGYEALPDNIPEVNFDYDLTRLDANE